MLRSVVFDVVGEAEPGLLPRVLTPFARRDLLTDQVRARRFGNVIEISITVDAMPGQEVHLVEGNLRQIVGIRRVEVTLRGMVRAVA